LAIGFSSFITEKLFVNEVGFNFTIVAAPADDTVNPVATIAPTAVRLASLPNFFVRMCHPYPGLFGPFHSLPDDPQRAVRVGLNAALTILRSGP
jgi:hypothetical protein